MDTRTISGFSLIPSEIKKQIWSHLDIRRLQLSGSTSKGMRNECMKYSQLTHNHIYYAVGIAINLLEMEIKNYNQFSQFAFSVAKKDFSQDEIRESLNHYNIIKMFTDMNAAESYCRYLSKSTFIPTLDWYDTVRTPAIYVVKVNNALFKRSRVYSLRDTFDEPAHQPEKSQLATQVTCIETPVSNCKNILYAKLDAASKIHFFAFNWQTGCPKEFITLWNSAIEENRTSDQAFLSRAIINLFSSYSSTFYASSTRHHQKDVDRFLDYMRTNPDISEVFDALKKLQMMTIEKKNYNPEGHFRKMLDFALARLSEWKEAANLPDINGYFNCKR